MLENELLSEAFVKDPEMVEVVVFPKSEEGDLIYLKINKGELSPQVTQNMCLWFVNKLYFHKHTNQVADVFTNFIVVEDRYFPLENFILNEEYKAYINNLMKTMYLVVPIKYMKPQIHKKEFNIVPVGICLQYQDTYRKLFDGAKNVRQLFLNKKQVKIRSSYTDIMFEIWDGHSRNLLSSMLQATGHDIEYGEEL